MRGKTLPDACTWLAPANFHADDGPGLLRSRAFWIGGILSLALWGLITWSLWP